MFAVLGDVEFDLITYFDGLETRFGADYAEHARIARKPRLQFVGDKLDEVRIDLAFHASYCDPEAELIRLRDALASHDSLSLVFGNGDYKGRFVIVDLSATGRQTDKSGTLIAVEASMTLREFTGDPARPLPPAVYPSGNMPRMLAQSNVVTALPANIPPTPSAGLSNAVTASKVSLSSIIQALSAVASLRAMAGGNLIGAMGRLPGVTRSVESALPGLGASSGQMDQYRGVSSVGTDAGVVAQSLARIHGAAGSVAGSLSGATSSDLLSRLTAAEGAVNLANAENARTTAPLARLSAQAVTRSV